MNHIATQQAALDNTLVPSEKRLNIERCNARIAFTKLQKEETYQVTLDALKLSPCYPAFQITVEELIYSRNCEMLSTIRTNQMHQPWRTFVVVINKCISGKTTGLDRLKESRAQIIEISLARKEHIPYLRFTKVIINHFISKDNTISMRNKINLHTIHDDTMLGTLKFISKIEYYQKYGALIPDGMINQDIKDSKAYKTYLDYATWKVPPKKARKFKKPASPKLKTIPSSPNVPVKKSKRVKRPAKKSTLPTASVVIRDTPSASVSKKKTPAKSDRGKCIELLSDASLLEDAHIEKALKKSKRETYKLQASGSSEGADFEPEVLDEPTGKPKDTSEGTGEKPGVLDVSKDDSTDSEADSWGNSEEKSDDVNDEDDNNDDNEDDDGGNDDGGNDDEGNEDDKKTKSDNDENPSLTLKDYKEEETQEDEYVHTPLL
nr:hypothetical protein [Tanacetum cinerariifolium]